MNASVALCEESVIPCSWTYAEAAEAERSVCSVHRCAAHYGWNAHYG